MTRAAIALLTLLTLIAPSAPPPFTIERIASVDGAREIAITPSGDLFVGTSAGDVYLVANAESHPQAATVFVSPQDAPAAGVAFSNGSLYVGTQHAIWRVPVRAGDRHARSSPQLLAHVRQGEAPPGSDNDVHTTTSVAADAAHVYASVGSSCNACVEIDPTRATVGEVRAGRYTVVARRIRNAIGLAIDERGHLWAADAGQDELQPAHPYEFFDDVSTRKAPADYGWPDCYEDRRVKAGTHANCNGVVVPLIIFPAYETPIGAAFYPQHQSGKYAFPQKWRGAFVTLHGSWHGPSQGLAGYLPPRVVFVPMRGGAPGRPADWSDPSRQWTQFIGGYQAGGSHGRTGRPTGIAVGPQGSLFVTDDLAGAIYRIRPR